MMRGVGEAAQELGYDNAERCLLHFLMDAADQNEFEILASYLTIGETYFFREPRSFEFLAESVLTPLLTERARTTKMIRIWSAGCCSGEEVYTLAILVDQLLGTAPDWNVTILGTDINRRFLERAERGRYGAWSFRQEPPGLRSRYFSPSEDGRMQVVTPRLRKMVSFYYLNLAQDHFPSVMSMTNAMDIIFCRNVLMYFTPEIAQKVVAFFHRSLLDGGVLVTSAVEASGTNFANFAALRGGEVPIFRKIADEPAPIPMRIAEARLPVPDEPLPSPNAAPESPEPSDLLTQARDFADRGKLDEALARCGEAIAIDKVWPSPHYLQAMIHQERGEPAEAVSALKRVLFLDKSHALACYSLAELEHRLGRERESVRHYRNAMDLVEAMGDPQPLADGEGMTAGRLRDILRAALHSERTPPRMAP
jgi:chemotaxis protein methyltransferase CheR